MKFSRIIAVSLLCLALGAGTASARGDTLTVAAPSDAKTLDPHGTPESGSHNVMKQIYESLVTYNDKQEIVPLLAEKWEVIEDNKAHKFYLKKGVKFHNGEELKADDVLFTFQRATSPSGAAIHAFSNYIDPKGLEVVDDHTIIVRTKQPMGSSFLASMNHPWSSILNRKAVEQFGKDYGMNPVGTGKFKFDSWSKGDRITMTRFDGYHGEKAGITKLIIRTVIEAASRTIELESGAVDLAIELPTVDVRRLQENKALNAVLQPGQMTFHLGMDMVNKKPYNDIRVRQAMNMAVNRAGIVKAVFKGYAEQASGPISSAIKYNKVKATPVSKMDLEKAKQLLKEAGYPNGFKSEILTADRTDYINIATVLQENFRRIGIDCEIKVFEWGTYIDAIKTPGHAPYVMPWWGGAPALDPFFLYGPQFHSVSAGQTNRAFLKDPEIDALLDKGAELNDGPEREAVYGKVWDRLNELLPWVCIAYPNSIAAMDKTLKGVRLSPGLISHYGNAYFEK